MPLEDLDKEIEVIWQEMRDLPLSRDDVRFLRDELGKLRAPHMAAKEQKRRELEEAERETLRLRREKMATFKEDMASLQRTGTELDLEGLTARFDDLRQRLETLEISKIEKQQLERQFRPIKNILAEKKEESLLCLSEDDRKTLENLRLILQQKKERRQEIKETIDVYRKTLGGSNLDFEKAMLLREQIDQEKEQLEKMNAGIAEIEGKIAELES